MLWDGQQDGDLFTFYQGLIRARLEAKPWAVGS